MGEVVDISCNRKKSGKPEGLAHILFYGHSTVLITSERGQRIIIDPWLEGNPLCPEDLKNPNAIEAIVLTHGHSDHTGSALALAEKTGATVFAPYELANLLGQDGLPEQQIEPMGKGGTVALSKTVSLNKEGAQDGKEIKIHLTNAFHSSSYTKKDGSTHYAGEPCGVVVELESGRSIYHAGDTSLFNDMSLINEKFEPEVALLPVGDRFTMGPLDAARAAHLIKPKIVIPIHYKTFDLLSGEPEVFSKYLLNTKIEVVTLEPGEDFSF